MPYIGLDVGTSGCKAAIIDEKGIIIKMANAKYSFVYPSPNFVELAPEVVWSSVKQVLREIAPMSGDVEMLAVSSIGEAMVMLDEKDHPLYNGIIYLDLRCKDMIPEVVKKLNEEQLHQISGVPVNQMYSLFRYIWFQKHKMDILIKTKRICLFGDYITYMLTGGIQAIDPSSASRTLLFNVNHLNWSDEIMSVFDISREKFSKVCTTGTVLENIHKVLAEELGLPKTIKIVLGCHDQCSATLGSGVVEIGDIMLGEGSTESMNLLIKKEEISDKLIQAGVCYEPYILPEQFLVPMGQLAHGNSIRWFVENFGSDFAGEDIIPNEDIYEKANRGCAENIENLYFLPYLSGASSTGRDSYALGGFLGMDIATGKAQMYRALLEGLCYESKHNFDILQQFGFQIGKVVASGGCSKSSLFMQMKADILKQNINVLENHESGIRGLGMICAVAYGDYVNYAEAAKQFVKIAKQYIPQRDYTEKYEEYYKISEIIKRMYRKTL